MGKQLREDKPKFNPDQEFTPVNGTPVTQEKPKFNPNKPFEPVKKKEPTTSAPEQEDGTTVPGSNVSSMPSPSDTEPTSKPTAKTKLKTRVTNLSRMYQNQFQDELKPFLDTQQSQYESSVKTKQDELQSLVDSKKLNVDQANSQLKEFSQSKKLEFDNIIQKKSEEESGKFAQKHGKEISKWLELYNSQFVEEDFQENKITNPLESFGKTAWSTFTQDIPSSAYAARALGRSAKGKVDQKIFNALEDIGIPKIDEDNAEGIFSQALKFITGATDEQVAKSFEQPGMTIDAANKKLVIEDLQAATELSNASAESKKYLINNLDRVKSGDWLDVLNYVASASGQGAGQIPASIGTRGATSLIQEMGSIYLDSVNKIAQESGLTVEEVIKQGKDDVVYPILSGIGAGLLDAYGANRVAKAFGKDQVLNSFRQRAKELAKTGGYESITEGAQGAIEEIGINKAAGKTWQETLKNINPDVVKESALQGGIAGLFLGGAGQVARAGIKALEPGQIKPKFNPEMEVKTIDSAIKAGDAKVSLQADKPTETVIDEQKIAVDPTNPASVANAAATILQAHEQEQKAPKVETTEGQPNVLPPVGDAVPTTEGGASQTVPTTQPITDDKGTEKQSGVPEQLPASEEAKEFETLREQILNSPDDLKWDEAKKNVTILTEKGLGMVQRFKELKQSREATAAEKSQIQTDGKVKTEGRQEGLLDDQSSQQVRTSDEVRPAEPLTAKEQELAKNYKSFGPEEHAVAAKIYEEKIQKNPDSPKMKVWQDLLQLHTKLSTPTNESNTSQTPLPTEQADAPQQEPMGGGQGGPVVQDNNGTAPATEQAPQIETGKEATSMENQPSPEQSTVQPVAQEGKGQVSETPSPVTSRPIDPPPQTADAQMGQGTGSTVPPVNDDADARPTGSSGERQTINKLQEQSTLSDTLKEGIEDFKEYEVKKQSRSRENAQKYIKRVGEDQALQDAISFKFARPQEEKIALLAELADQFSSKFKKAESEGNQADIDQYYSKFMTAMNTLSNTITDTAQALSYLNLVGTVFQTKTGALRFAKNQIEQSREGAMRNHEALKLTAEQLIKEFDTLPKEEFLKSKAVQDLIAQMRSQSPKSQKARQAERKLKDAGDKLRELVSRNRTGIIFDPKSTAQDQVEITKALVNYIKALIQKLAIDANEKIQNVTQQVVEGVKSFSSDIGLTISDQDVNDLVQDTTAREFERMYKGDIRSAIKEYVDKGTGRDELIQKIIDSEGLTQEQSAEFTDRFIKIFNEYLTKEKERIVKRLTPKERKPSAKRKEFYDKVIQLSNAGAVSDQALDDAVAQIFGLPAMTPEIASKIEDMVDDINKAPEGRFRNIAITKLTDYIAKQQKFNVTDYMLASFRAGIFSGIDTQALNLTGNFFNVLEMGFMLSMVNPKAAARFIGSVRNPTSISRAIQEAAEILRTGFDPRVAGDAKRRVLEQRDRTLFGLAPGLKGWKQVLDPQLEQQKKYVFRALSAGDILFSQGINDALQQEMFARAAKAQGLKGSEAKQYVREQMGFTPENIQAALDQANNEALAGSIPNDPRMISLRAKEIIEQKRDPNVVAKSREYAQEQILTNSPKGYIGIIARAINSVIQQLPVFSALIPVVNFAANAMQRAVQYVPPAALARGAAHYLGRMGSGENLSTIIKDDISRLKSGDLEQEMRLRRFAAGTVSLIILAALLDEDDEGNNLLSKLVGKTVRIHGSGPGTKLNRSKTYQLQETGYLPYSIQMGDTYVPYKNYPGLNVLLSTFGEYEDAKRYGKLDKKDALNRLVFAIVNSFAVISEMGFLTSLNTTTQAFLEANPKEFTSIVTRPVGGILVPKFQRNLINFFDNNVYSGRDVQEIAIRSIPVLNTAAGDPLVNALGEPVERNWWDRVELWNNDSYSKNKPIWDANMKNNYYFTMPSKSQLEETFDRTITTAEYNKFFELRGKEIIKEFTPDIAELPQDEYARKMDVIVDIAKYRALVQMGVMESDLMKEIKFQLDDLYEMKRRSNDLKKEIKP